VNDLVCIDAIGAARKVELKKAKVKPLKMAVAAENLKNCWYGCFTADMIVVYSY
jgi:hypothetical protein